MEPSSQPHHPWFKDHRLLIAGAVGAAAIALIGAAVGIASARTDTPSFKPTPSSGELSVEIQAPRETRATVLTSGKMQTLDPAALNEQRAPAALSDPQGDENLRVIDAQERRLQAMNEREAAAFAAQMRQTQRDDAAMAREERGTQEDGSATPLGLSTSNTTGAPDQD